MNSNILESTLCLTKFKDFRYILDDAEWKNKEVNFPVEILCSRGDRVVIENSTFNEGLIIRLGNGISIDNIYIYNTKIKGKFRVVSCGGEVAINLGIDSCEFDTLELNGLRASVDIYKTKIEKLSLESNKFSKFKLDVCSVVSFSCYYTVSSFVDIANNTFKSGGVVPSKLFSDFNKRFKNKEYAQDATVQTLDFLLNNRSTSVCAAEYSDLLYYRNKAKTKSVFAHCLLWLFGYFNDLARYVTTALICLSVVFFSLMVVSMKTDLSLTISALIRLSIDSFIGLSNTYGYSDNHLISIVLSTSIGFGTIYYSGLLLTLINRFRIRF